MNELISVIVPVYNGEQYLPLCVDSLLTQTYKNLEILLVDDGSRDGSPALCDEYAARDGRIRVIHQENQGVSGARNTGLSHATGAYVTFVDGDDYVEPDYLERLYRNLVDHHGEFSCCSYTEVIRGDVEPISIPFVAESRIIEDPAVFFEDMVNPREAYWSTSTLKLYRRTLIGDTRFCRELKYGEDQVFFFDLLCKEPKACLDTYQGYYYIRNESSATLSRNASNVFRCENEMKMHEYKLRNLPTGAQHLKSGFWEMYGHGIHNLARALALSGTPDERRAYRKDMVRRIDECFRAGKLSSRTRLFLSLYRYVPCLYALLIRFKSGRKK